MPVEFVNKITAQQGIDSNTGIATENMVSEWGGIQYAELSVILVHLKHLSMLHQTNHWISKGDPFYGDHLMFQRLYESTLEEIDALAEKAVGLGSEKNVEICLQLKQIEKLCSGGYGMSVTIPQPSELILKSLSAERHFMKVVQSLSDRLAENGLLTSGLDNLLCGIEDTHEGHLYLLKQRAGQSGIV